MTTATPAYGASIVACDNCGARNRVPAAMTTGSPRCGRCRDPWPGSPTPTTPPSPPSPNAPRSRSWWTS
ncbi:hypothetical protein ACFQZ3_25805 [Thermocatellispora tengchongensis]|uniref:hypothetical protein n=1 Tax=Thermocatellispora tengchongensis TaxID=1073253 RepID=UPI00362CE5BD